MGEKLIPRRPAGYFFAALFTAAGYCQPVESRYQAPENWLTHDRDNTGQRFSPLRQIHTGNISDLVVQWTFQFHPLPTRSQVTPLVRDGVMYATVGGDNAFALDARTGRRLWHYRYRFKAEGSTMNWNRGFALHGERLFMVTADAHLIALDARNGSLLWDSVLADPNQNYGATAAGLIVGDRVIVGNAGGDSGTRGFLDAYQVSTGERLWRFWTIPAPGEAGSETWPHNESWKGGGGATWTTGTYDPSLNLVYWTTGNAGPKDYDGRDREGDNLYACSLIALDPVTGKLAWHYQFTPHDVFDWDANEPPILLDLEWEGRPRKVVMQANRNGFFYVLDRTNGQFLRGKAFSRQTWLKEFTPVGRPVLNAGASPSTKGTVICPDPYGGINWQSPTYSPLTGLLYVPTHDACAYYYYTGPSYDPAVHKPEDSLQAIDVRTGQTRWKIPLSGPSDHQMAGAVSTAGGLVFFANRDGYFMAADAVKGRILWHFYTGGSIRASPMAYAVDGKQYIAIATRGALYVFATHGR